MHSDKWYSDGCGCQLAGFEDGIDPQHCIFEETAKNLDVLKLKYADLEAKLIERLAEINEKDNRIAVLEKDHVWRLTVAENQDRIIQDNIARIAALESELSTTKSILDATQAALRRASQDVTL